MGDIKGYIGYWWGIGWVGFRFRILNLVIMI